MVGAVGSGDIGNRAAAGTRRAEPRRGRRTTWRVVARIGDDGETVFDVFRGRSRMAWDLHSADAATRWMERLRNRAVSRLRAKGRRPRVSPVAARDAAQAPFEPGAPANAPRRSWWADNN